jgi:hypothetical protein
MRMDLSVYLDLVVELFTQYWPHEHLDRPATFPVVPDHPVTTKSYYDDRKGTLGSRSRSGIYDYLQEMLEVVAAKLTHLDLTWASDYLKRPGQQPDLDSDIQFQRGLALLGHTVHAVEDFFAHSNFVDHAARALGGRYLPGGREYVETRFLKRLKRYDPTTPKDADWTRADPEHDVLTGYFDFADTLTSLGHVGEHYLCGKWGLMPKDIGRVARLFDDPEANEHEEKPPKDEKKVGELDQVVSDLLELLTDPELIRDRANRARPAVRGFVGITSPEETDDDVTRVRAFAARLKRFPVVTGRTAEERAAQQAAQQAELDALRPFVGALPVFHEIEVLVPAKVAPEKAGRIYRALLVYVRYMTMDLPPTAPLGAMRSLQADGDGADRTAAGADVRALAGGLGFTTSLYQIKRTVAILQNNPIAWLLSQITVPEVVKRVLDYPVYYAKESLYDATAADRIGCHSLMAKDHEDETEIYKGMWSCAAAAHYVVVDTMMRWSTPEYRDPALPASKQWVDWKHLLEHFLGHPLDGLVCSVPRQVAVGVTHVLGHESDSISVQEVLEQLADDYAHRILKTVHPEPTGGVILGANMSRTVLGAQTKPTQADIVAGKVLPAPLASAFRMRQVVIPAVKYDVMTCHPRRDSERWYMPVMDTGWAVARDQRARLGYQPRFHPHRDAAVEVVTFGDELLTALMQRYQ